MEYCPLRNKSTLEITTHLKGIVSLSRCSYLKEIVRLRYQDLKDIDILSMNYEDFLRKKSSPLCTVNCKSLESSIKNVIIGISRACNLNCYHCFNHNVHTDSKEEKEFYFYLLDKVKNHSLDSLLLGSQGEVFVYYDEILSYLKSLSIDDFKTVILQTNATLLNKKRIEELKSISDSTGVKYQFFVSMSGITKETYEATQINANFESTLKNIQYLLENFGSSNIRVTYVIKRPNIEDSLNIRHFFKTLGLEHIDISYDVYDYGCKEVYDALLKSDVGKCIYETYKKEKCAGSSQIKKYLFTKNNALSMTEIQNVYNNQVISSEEMLNLEESAEQAVEDSLPEDEENQSLNEFLSSIEDIGEDNSSSSYEENLLTIGVIMHGNQMLSDSIEEAIKTNDKINWIISNDDPQDGFEILKERLKDYNVTFIAAEPGIENNRQNILNNTNTKFIYIVDYDDEIKINQNNLLNFLNNSDADIIPVRPYEDGRDTSNYIYYDSVTMFVVTWAQIFKTSFMRQVGGYIQTWNSYHEEFGTNANMLAYIYKNNLRYEMSTISKNCIYYNHILGDSVNHNSMQKVQIKDYLAFISGIPSNDRILYKKEFIEFFKMRLSLMNLSTNDYRLIEKVIDKVVKKI